MCPKMFLALMICVVAVAAEVKNYRFTVTNENRQKVQKDIQVNEKEGIYVMKLSDGNSKPMKTEMHDVRTGYAAIKNGSNQCILIKSPYTLNDLKNGLISELKKNPKLAPASMYMEDIRPLESGELKQAGGKIKEFCGSLAVLKATPRKMRTRHHKDKKGWYLLGIDSL
uniref:Uncharacterized protein n=1 Tax=Pinctada fucata TaxID=50426 RepID=A0A194AK06_PINFU